jgi:hypothetical protein
MNIFEDLQDELQGGIHSTIPDFWTVMYAQYGDVSMPVNTANTVSKNTTIPVNTSTLFHPRIAVHVENFFLHP